MVSIGLITAKAGFRSGRGVSFYQLSGLVLEVAVLTGQLEQPEQALGLVGS